MICNPRLLPAATWREFMAGLDRHFGVDASLDPPTVAAITNWLVKGAGSPRPPPRHAAGGAPRDDASSLRITTTSWFVREHREVRPSSWRRAVIGSAANCAACHTDALQGRFYERALRIPD